MVSSPVSVADSNRQPLDCQSTAVGLTTVLRWAFSKIELYDFNQIRTYYSPTVNRALRV